MDHGSAQAQGVALNKNRHDEGDIRQVGTPQIRVVHNENVAFDQGLHGITLENLRNNRDQGPQMNGDGNGLRQGFAAECEKTCRGVEALLDDG